MPELITLYKLIILEMLRTVDFPLTYAQISTFVLERGYTDYFTLQSVLAELAESHMVSLENIRHCSYYSLTESGAEALKFFHNRLSPSLKEEIRTYMKENKIEMHDEVSVLADYRKTPDGEYQVHLVVRDRYSDPIDLKLTVLNAEQAKKACSRWKEKCEDIYSQLISELIVG